jgi:2-dehydropantoate 2-reductase
LAEATDRVEVAPTLVVPLLNGLDHMGFLTERFQGDTVAAGAIRVESDRRSPGVIVHSSPFLRVDMAGPGRVAAAIERLAATLERSGVPARVCGSEAEVLWGKLVRLNALACTTSAFDKLLGEILSTPELRSELVGAIDEGCAVAAQERAPIEPGKPLAELAAAHATLGSSMQRDIAAGRLPEIDAIPGSVLRAADRHGIDCPTIERMVELILRRAGLPASAVSR